MNTRLQVEHPVTELTTGLDLVELQLHVADGERLDAEPPAARGHSIEARIYAEDPARNWQPQAGPCTASRCPLPQRIRSRHAAPVSGWTPGSSTALTVSIHYDPMLAKVISYAPTRRAGRARCSPTRWPERDCTASGPTATCWSTCCVTPRSSDGATDTAFFDTHGLAELAQPLATDRAVRLSAVAATLADAAHNRATATVLSEIPSGWRNLASGDQHKTYRDDAEGEHRVAYRFTRRTVALPDDEGITLVSASPDEVVLFDETGVATAFTVARYGTEIYVDSPLVRSRSLPCRASPNPDPSSRRDRCWRRCPVR